MQVEKGDRLEVIHPEPAYNLKVGDIIEVLETTGSSISGHYHFLTMWQGKRQSWYAVDTVFRKLPPVLTEEELKKADTFPKDITDFEFGK